MEAGGQDARRLLCSRPLSPAAWASAVGKRCHGQGAEFGGGDERKRRCEPAICGGIWRDFGGAEDLVGVLFHRLLQRDVATLKSSAQPTFLTGWHKINGYGHNKKSTEHVFVISTQLCFGLNKGKIITVSGVLGVLP
jgi:hypothetical protein